VGVARGPGGLKAEADTKWRGQSPAERGGRFSGGDDGPTLILNGHTDTVTAGDEQRWMHAPFGAEVVEDRLYGRGATDMKGGLTAILERWARSGRPGSPEGIGPGASVIGEEDGGPVPLRHSSGATRATR
jgi:hypothetical protein